MKPIPFLRICLPFIGGITLANAMPPVLDVIGLCFASITLLILLVCFVFFWKVKWLSFILFDLFFLVLAFMQVNLINSNQLKECNPDFFDVKKQQVYVAYISEIPVQKTKFVKCQCHVFSVKCQQRLKPFDTEIIAYIRKEAINVTLKQGTVFVFQSTLMRPSGPKNPGEFNYAKYLQHKHIYYTAFIQQNKISLDTTSIYQATSLKQFGLAVKYHMLLTLNHANLLPITKAICAALITGYDDDIEASVVNAFAQSGTLHVLSVSGLHTGLIYMLLNFIFNIFDPHEKYKKSRFAFITLVLWFFAVITGFSAPVLRAVLMFNFLGMATLLKRRSALLSVNILMLSAFVLLFYNADYLFDVGFLLSYAAMLGILIFAPPMLLAWQSDNKYMSYVIESMVVSVAATISTLPITLYFFNQFPTWFIICNLVVVPMSFVILLLSFLPLLNVMWLNPFIDALVQAMVAFIGFFSSGSYSSISYIHFTDIDAVFLSLLIWFLYQFTSHKSFSQVFAALLVLVLWQSYGFFDSNRAKQKSLLAVYAIKNKHLCVVKNKTLAIYNRRDSAAFQFSLKNHFVDFNYACAVYRPFNFVQYGNHHLLILNKPGFLPQAASLSVNKILLANNFRLLPQHLKQYPSLSMVMADASNSAEIIEQTALLCRKFGLRFYDIRKNGAYLLPLL